MCLVIVEYNLNVQRFVRNRRFNTSSSGFINVFRLLYFESTVLCASDSHDYEIVMFEMELY